MEKVLFLKGDFVEKIWGGDKLKDFSYNLPADNIGEYWAISGMEEKPSKILNGKFEGKSLDFLYKNHKELFGENLEESFPLLVKLIDANDDLSIQVHPDDLMGKEMENSRGKTECWYILNEDPSSIIYGLKVDDKNKAKQLIDDKKWEDLLKEVPAKKGDFFYVPAGTVHAIKKGCLILEIQQASDVTYRLYDYDRKDKEGNLRDLHLEKSKKALKANKIQNERNLENYKNYTKEELLSNEYFEVRKYDFDGEVFLERQKDYLLEAVVEGEGKLIIDKKEMDIKKGDFFIITNLCDNFKIKGKLEIIEANAK